MIEVDIDSVPLVGVPGHLAREAVGRRRSGGHDVRGLQSRSENHLRARCTRLCEKPSIESALFGSAADEPTVRLAAANHARDATMIVERCPVSRPKVEISSDADAIEEDRNGFALRRRLDDLQIANEACADVRLRLVDLHRPPALRQSDRRREARWPRACNADGLHLSHLIVLIRL